MLAAGPVMFSFAFFPLAVLGAVELGARRRELAARARLMSRRRGFRPVVIEGGKAADGPPVLSRAK